MSLPLLRYPLSSQNQRVNPFSVSGDDQPRIYSSENLLSPAGLDALITSAYKQIFHEQQMLRRNRQSELESQLRSGQVTVKQFIRGLLLSDSFRRMNYDSNNNYRFAEICVQRVLGRNLYGDREKLSWSIILATQGIQGFVDALLESDEYLLAFGDDVVPYQRNRILPQRPMGELPFVRTSRYENSFLDRVDGMRQKFSNVSRGENSGESLEVNGEILFILGFSLLIAIALLLTYSTAAQLNFF